MAERIQMVGDRLRPMRLIEEPEEIENPILAFFLNYWRESLCGASLPLRASFTPQKVRGNLPWVVMADALPDCTDFRFRVVGSRVAEYFLGNGTGKTIRDAFKGTDKGFVDGTLWLYQRTCSERTPIRLTGPSSTYHHIYFPNFDALYLPYSSDGECADRVVNVFTFNYEEMALRVLPSDFKKADMTIA
jgi:hypothetical protein